MLSIGIASLYGLSKGMRVLSGVFYDKLRNYKIIKIIGGLSG